MSNTTPISQTKIKVDILELMIRTISDEETGKIPPQFADAFTEFQTDGEGFPFLQTLAGIVTLTKDKNEVVYSPNYGYHAEQVAIESSNLCKLAVAQGWEFRISPAHFITPDGQFFSGTNAYNAWRALEQNMIINAIKQRAQAQKESEGPKLILPDTNIIKPH